MTVSAIGFLQRRRRSSPASFLIPKLPAVDLLTVLHSLSADISAVSPPPPPPTPIYRRHSAAIVRKCGIISAIFEEILRFNRKIKFSQSSILIFEEMFIVLQRIKALIDDISNGTSKIWLIIQIESVSSLFHDLTLDLRTLLELLPRNEFDLSEDVTELFTLVVNRCRVDKCFVDPVDEELRKAVLSLVESVRCGVVPDSVRLGEIFGRLGLSDSVSCREEIECLQDELTCQKDDKARSDVVGFVGLVRYAKTVLFGVLTPSLAESTRWNSSSELNAPTDFRCPISLELMSDPVVVSTGQTYERSSITLWIESDRKTCPKTGQTLAHTGLIPNKALKSLIATWCRENRVAYVAVDDNEGQTGVVVNKVALEAIKMTVSYLLGKLELSSVADLDSVEAVNRLVYELRVLAKTDSDSRACMGEAGAVPLLVRFLGSEHPNLQINAVTTLLNLSILEANKGRIMDIDGALNGVIEVLRSGATWEAKANAAATVFSLAGVSAYRKRLGKKSRVIKGLLELARAGPTSSKRDALVAILTLAGDREIAGRLIEGGAIDTIKEIMGELPEEAMTILETVVKKGGLVAVAAVNDMIGRLVATLRTGTDRTKESAIATLVIICRRGGAEMVAELAKVSTIEMVIWELMGNGTTRAKRKAASLMRMLRRWSAGVEGAGVLEEFATTVAIN